MSLDPAAPRLSPVARRSRLARLRAVSAREWLDLARAQLALAGARLRLRMRARGALAVATADAAAPEPVVPLPAIRRAVALAWAVDRAARHGLVGGSCLARAMALQQLLARDGITGARLRVGVRQDDGTFAAHAWVELAGRGLGEPGRERGRYTVLAGLDASALAGLR